MIMLFRHPSELTPYLLHTIQAMGNGCGDAIENLCRNMCNRLPTINLGYTWVGVYNLWRGLNMLKCRTLI